MKTIVVRFFLLKWSCTANFKNLGKLVVLWFKIKRSLSLWHFWSYIYRRLGPRLMILRANLLILDLLKFHTKLAGSQKREKFVFTRNTPYNIEGTCNGVVYTYAILAVNKHSENSTSSDWHITASSNNCSVPRLFPLNALNINLNLTFVSKLFPWFLNFWKRWWD